MKPKQTETRSVVILRLGTLPVQYRFPKLIFDPARESSPVHLHYSNTSIVLDSFQGGFEGGFEEQAFAIGMGKHEYTSFETFGWCRIALPIRREAKVLVSSKVLGPYSGLEHGPSRPSLISKIPG